MKTNPSLFRTATTAALILGFLVPSFGYAAGVTAQVASTTNMPNVADSSLLYHCSVDVVAGTSDCNGNLVTATDLESGRGKVRITFGSIGSSNSLPSSAGTVTNAVVTSTVANDAYGWLLNVADSETDNGFGVDWGTQSNNAEFHLNAQKSITSITGPDGRLIADRTMKIINNPANSISRSTRFSWALWGNDDIPESVAIDGYRLIAAKTDIPASDIEGHQVRVVVRDHQFDLGVVGTTAYDTTQTSPYLYAFNNEPDHNGPVNNDVYVGINRVVDGVYRSGYGVTRVDIELRGTSSRVGSPQSVASSSVLGTVSHLLRSRRQRDGAVAQYIAPIFPSALDVLSVAHAVTLQGGTLADTRVGTGFLFADQSRAPQLLAEVLRVNNPGLVTSSQTGVRKALRSFQRTNKLRKVDGSL